MTASDRVLALRFQAGDRHAGDVVIRRYERTASAIARSFHHVALEHDDLVQAARVGAFKACRDFDPASGPFEPFAYLCMRAEVFTLLTAARRAKHRPLDESVRELRNEDGETVPALDLVADPHADPADVYARREIVRRVAVAVASLTPLERHWLGHAANGLPYSRDVVGGKSGENAVDRARAKVRDAA